MLAYDTICWPRLHPAWYSHAAQHGYYWSLEQNSKTIDTNLLLHQLKCLGENKNSERKESGSCDRCRKNGIQCVFPQPSPTKGSKRRRSFAATSRTTKTGASASSAATMVSAATASSPQHRTVMTRAVLQNDMAYSATGDNKVLSDLPSGIPIGLQPSERVEQLDMTGTQSVGGQDRYPCYMNQGSDPTHQYDFNLSMLSTADDSYDFGFLPNDTNGWPTPVHGGNVYSMSHAMPHRSSTYLNADPLLTGNYNTDDFLISPASTTYPGEYSNSNSSGSWGMALHSNGRPFDMSTTRKNDWQH